MFKTFTLCGLLISIVLTALPGRLPAQKKADFSKSNLVAWCIVPFDAKQRSPEERAAMLHDLGITRLAYDWREQHIPTFDDELRALIKYGIKLEAFWMASGRNPANNPNIRAVFEFLERNRVKTSLWLMMTEWPGFEELSQQGKVEAMSREIRYIAEKAGDLGCEVALYNHGGWFGEPENQIEIIRYLNLDNVGMVYNFHHARKHLSGFADFYPLMQPYLKCINLAGLKKRDSERFYRVGQGDAEKEMIRQVWKSGYRGPFGIINHDENKDAEKGLLEEIAGLKWILFELGDKKALRTYH